MCSCLFCFGASVHCSLASLSYRRLAVLPRHLHCYPGNLIADGCSEQLSHCDGCHSDQGDDDDVFGHALTKLGWFARASIHEEILFNGNGRGVHQVLTLGGGTG